MWSLDAEKRRSPSALYLISVDAESQGSEAGGQGQGGERQCRRREEEKRVDARVSDRSWPAVRASQLALVEGELSTYRTRGWDWGGRGAVSERARGEKGRRHRQLGARALARYSSNSAAEPRYGPLTALKETRGRVAGAGGRTAKDAVGTVLGSDRSTSEGDRKSVV